MANVTVTRGRGRPAFEANKFNVVNALTAVRNEGDVAYHVVRKLVNGGFVVSQNVQTGTRGRPAKKYELTAKGRTYLNFSKNWK